MKKEYLDKIELAWNMLDYKDALSIEENEKCFDVAYDTLNELVATKNNEILERLLEFFCEDHEDYGGICEHLQSQIGVNYSLEQLICAIYKKFDYLVKNDVGRIVQFAFWFFNNGMFEDFRKMFNTVKSSESAKFLDELDDWADEDYTKERKILREDMKKW